MRSRRAELLAALLLAACLGGAATLVQAVFSWVEGFLALGLLSLAAWFTPGLRSIDSLRALFDGEMAGNLALYGAHAAAVLFVEPFFVASGFAMYLNRRVELEAWDVEQELRHAFAPR